MKNIALILLAGKGNRLGADIPKQFIEKNGVPIYIKSVRNYQNIPNITDILLVTSRDYIDKVKDDVKKYNLNKVIEVIEGGSERFISSYLGLKKLMNYFGDNDNVLIADAARPNTSSILILANIFGLLESKAVLTAIEGSSSGKRIDTCHQKGSRSYLAQTPQSFKLGYIYNLYNKYINEEDFAPFDDINVVELNGDSYDIVEGDPNNYKITTQEDLEKYLNN